VTGTPPDIFDAVFGEVLGAAVPRPEHPRTPLNVAVEANEKLSQNLDFALDRQRELVSHPITPETSPREKRLVADVAHQVVRTAVSVDEQRLKRKNQDLLPGILARLVELEKDEKLMQARPEPASIAPPEREPNSNDP
jgi:hypothetical protein